MVFCDGEQMYVSYYSLFAHIMCSYVHIYLTQGINGMKNDVEIGRRIRMYVTGQVYHVMILARLSDSHSQRIPNDRFCF